MRKFRSLRRVGRRGIVVASVAALSSIACSNASAGYGTAVLFGENSVIYPYEGITKSLGPDGVAVGSDGTIVISDIGRNCVLGVKESKMEKFA